MTTTKAEYDAFCAEFGVPDRIEMMLCDLNAVLRGKWLPGDEIDKLLKGDMRLPESTYAPNILGSEVEASGLGSPKGDPDGFLVPIPGTFKPAPWNNGIVAQVLVEMVDAEDEVSFLSPRQHLSNILDRFAAEGLKPVVATELEFYLLKKREADTDPPEPPDGLPDTQNYDLDALAQSENILVEIIETAKAQGLPTDALIAEYGPGQFEINFHHTDDVLAAADTAMLFRRLVIGVVNGHGLEATFMAKPYADQPGNGMHVHVSLLDSEGRNIFASEDGVHPLLKKAVAGVLDSMREFQLLFAPHLNSYRRFQPGSFAPCYPDWGTDHRGASIRIPETTGMGARLEHRIAGADANPYLVLAGILGGVWHGLHNDLPLPPPLEEVEDGGVAPLTHDWITAVDFFEKSKLAVDLFGKEYHDVLVAVKRDEIAQLTTVISSTEYRYYLSRL
ncbi:MAG: glutamine synthetase [Limimaricola sp.]|uniref:glutamine synthetase family protein n=1 Tax=Limimaricola sp. TaxID=2211665 RepID=UPI001DCDB614|nr:glutamine synthetase family protein [Limimaricola sp.]MBI1415923.1 glutamine synthetase [Limimaricola sp.]